MTQRKLRPSSSSSSPRAFTPSRLHRATNFRAIWFAAAALACACGESETGSTGDTVSTSPTQPLAPGSAPIDQSPEPSPIAPGSNQNPTNPSQPEPSTTEPDVLQPPSPDATEPEAPVAPAAPTEDDPSNDPPEEDPPEEDPPEGDPPQEDPPEEDPPEEDPPEEDPPEEDPPEEDPPEEDPPPATDCEGGTNADLGLIGWATENGGTTGGKGGDTITVTTGAELMEALEAKQDSTTPLTILVQGTITEANSGVNKIDVKDVSDVSILGAGSGAEFDGIGIKIVRASNIVVRNLRIHHVDIGDKDCISIEGPTDHIWIDHNELYNEYGPDVDKDYYDGLLDAKAESEYITYSWNYLHDSWKTSLVGSSESDTFDRKLTMHHNYYENCNSRLPLFRGGTAHIFNNLYVDIADTTINSRIGACVRIENNYFENAQNPWVSAFSDELGGGELICNIRVNSPFAYSDDVNELPTCSANVPYDYGAVLTETSSVPDLVRQNAGVGKLSDPADF